MSEWTHVETKQPGPDQLVLASINNGRAYITCTREGSVWSVVTQWMEIPPLVTDKQGEHNERFNNINANA